MHGLRAFASADLLPILRAAWWRSLGAIKLSPAAGYLRGLTLGRVGLVLVICAILTVRQRTPCVFQVGCGMPDGQTLALFILTYSSRALLFGGLATAALYLFVREREDAQAPHGLSLIWYARVNIV